MESVNLLLTLVQLFWAHGEKFVALVIGAGVFVTSLALTIRSLGFAVTFLKWAATLTKSTKDDEAVNAVESFLNGCASVLDKVSAALAKVPSKVHGK